MAIGRISSPNQPKRYFMAWLQSTMTMEGVQPLVLPDTFHSHYTHYTLITALYTSGTSMYAYKGLHVHRGSGNLISLGYVHA